MRAGGASLDNGLHFTGQSRRLYVEDVRNAQGMSTGGVAEYPVNVTSSGEPLKITLAWIEPAGTAGAANPVVNNLDLEVVAPGGAMYRGNVFSGGVSATGGAADPRNNVEMVLVNNPAPGEWTIRIVAAAVQTGATQGYAMVATGSIEPVTGCKPDLTTGAVPGQPGYGVPNGILNNDDFFYSPAEFSAGTVAVCDLTTCAVPGTPGYGVPNGVLNNDDFFYYLTLFSAGC